MTLSELYAEIDGDFEQATKVLRIEKLIDKHIRRLPANTIFAELDEAGKAMDGVRLFESAHAIKGVCSNLGLVKLSNLAAEICDDFRPGNARKYTDDQIRQKISEADALFEKAKAGIAKYEASAQ
ncbi:MAG: Hpt domain-containing protein [Clostridia bacterium]|nr:Hpt domain-containing protein [Clostridia bacterium]